MAKKKKAAQGAIPKIEKLLGEVTKSGEIKAAVFYWVESDGNARGGSSGRMHEVLGLIESARAIERAGYLKTYEAERDAERTVTVMLNHGLAPNVGAEKAHPDDHRGTGDTE